MKKKSKKTILIVVAIALIIGIYMYSQGALDTVVNPIKNAVAEDRGSNGWYDAESETCWSTPTGLQGGKKPMYSCCFDIQGYQVDCSDASKRLSGSQVTYAIYFPEGGSSTPKIYEVLHSVTISNAQNTAFSKVWIESANWNGYFANGTLNTAGAALVNTRWDTMEGYSNAKSLPLAAGANLIIPMTGKLSLQELSPNKNTPVIYNASIVTRGEYVLANGTTMRYTGPAKIAKFTVTKEEIGFSVTINLNA